MLISLNFDLGDLWDHKFEAAIIWSRHVDTTEVEVYL